MDQGRPNSGGIITTGDFADFGTIGTPTKTPVVADTTPSADRYRTLPVQGSPGIHAQIDAALRGVNTSGKKRKLNRLKTL